VGLGDRGCRRWVCHCQLLYDYTNRERKSGEIGCCEALDSRCRGEEIS
jgi:hypothetical protein